jgi:GNAT superfamily N-acetyltransferase
VSGRTLAYEPARRAEVFALLDRVRGYELDPAEFDWWFDGNPVGPRTIALAEEENRVVGVLGASHYRAVVDGREELATLPLWAVTDPEFQGRGIFQRLNGEVERAARETGAALELGFTNKLAGPIYIAKLGWLDVARLRIWARPLLLGRDRDEGERLQRFGPQQEDAYRVLRDRLPSHFVRDSAYLNWRYADSPRVAERVRRRRAQAGPGDRHRLRRRPRRPDVPRDASAAPALCARGAWCARVARAASRSACDCVRLGRVRADA